MSDNDEDKTIFEPAKKRQKYQLQEGEVLNGLFKIVRFIAAGGMGEVYEAVNIHPPYERVAIKLILPESASDEQIIEMFAKEADTLTRLHHESIVQYRLAARDSEGRPFIVTAFVDGPSLEDEFGNLDLDEMQFGDLAIRLARGLGEAHKLGAIHRDIAPDNILLVDGDPAQPKIIDFGIAKDAREENAGKTIIGDGFAGKLKYVAPEQMGEYDGNIGPWTDVYSLALTLLAVSIGRHVDMGGSMADAVKKRMFVPNLSSISETHRSAFEAALQPNPIDRLQSMKEFISKLNAAPVRKKRTLWPVYSGLAIASLLVIGVSGFHFLTRDIGTGVPPKTIKEGEVNTAEVVDESVKFDNRQFTNLSDNIAKQTRCSWLNYQGNSGGKASFVGATGVRSALARELLRVYEFNEVKNVDVNIDSVLSFDVKLCRSLDFIKTLRSSDTLIASDQIEYEITPEYRDRDNGARAIFHTSPTFKISSPNSAKWVALIYITQDGKFETLAKDIEELAGYGSQNTNSGFEISIPFGGVEGTPASEKKSSLGVYGFLLIQGDGPFPDTRDPNLNQAAWMERLRQDSEGNNWKADIAWISIVDNEAD